MGESPTFHFNENQRTSQFLYIFFFRKLLQREKKKKIQTVGSEMVPLVCVHDLSSVFRWALHDLVQDFICSVINLSNFRKQLYANLKKSWELFFFSLFLVYIKISLLFDVSVNLKQKNSFLSRMFLFLNQKIYDNNNK